MRSDMMGTIANRMQFVEFGFLQSDQDETRSIIKFKNCPTGKCSRKIFSLLMLEFVAFNPMFVDGYLIPAAPSYHA